MRAKRTDWTGLFVIEMSTHTMGQIVPGVSLEIAPGRTNQAIKTVPSSSVLVQDWNRFQGDKACEVASYDFVRKYL